MQCGVLCPRDVSLALPDFGISSLAAGWSGVAGVDKQRGLMNMTEQPPWSDEERHLSGLSEPELRFNRRWRELVDKAGGRKRVINRIGWTKSTVSRDYRGETPPSDERLRQLSDYLKLSGPEHDEMLRLLEPARQARQSRKTPPMEVTAPSSQTVVNWLAPGDAHPSMGTATAHLVSRDNPRQGVSPPPRHTGHARPRSRDRRKVAVLIGAGVIAGVLLTVAALLLPDLWERPSRPGPAADAPVARGSFPGIGIKAVAIAKSSLTTQALASALGHGRTAGASTVDGYVFRNMNGPTFCLTAAGSGAAGQNRDRVEVATCDGAASQVWIPEQWEVSGTRFTWLVNYRYQSKCLNANNIGGLANGHRTQLWDCYPSPNEYWDFGDWFTNVKSDDHAYPIFMESARFCLDADKFDFRDDTSVNIWDQYPTANQFWS